MSATSRRVLFDTAQVEGRRARVGGTAREDCPYRRGEYSMKYMGWMVGWDGAYDRTDDEPCQEPQGVPHHEVQP